MPPHLNTCVCLVKTDAAVYNLEKTDLQAPEKEPLQGPDRRPAADAERGREGTSKNDRRGKES